MTPLTQKDMRAVQQRSSCKSRRERNNEYLLAKIGFDTAENEPCKVCPLKVPKSFRYFDNFDAICCIFAWFLYFYFRIAKLCTKVRKLHDLPTRIDDILKMSSAPACQGESDTGPAVRPKLAKMRKNIAALGRPYAAYDIAKDPKIFLTRS